MSTTTEQQALNSTAHSVRQELLPCQDQEARVIVTTILVPNCCGSVDVKTGANIFAIINIVVGLLELVGYITLSCLSIHKYIISILCCLTGVLIGALVLDGVRKEKSSYLVAPIIACILAIAYAMICISASAFVASTMNECDLRVLWSLSLPLYVTKMRVGLLLFLFFIAQFIHIFYCAWQAKVLFDCFKYMKYKEQNHAGQTVHTQTFGNDVYRAVI